MFCRINMASGLFQETVVYAVPGYIEIIAAGSRDPFHTDLCPAVFLLYQGQGMETADLAFPVFPGQGQKHQPVFEAALAVFFQMSLDISFIGFLNPWTNFS